MNETTYAVQLTDGTTIRVTMDTSHEEAMKYLLGFPEVSGAQVSQ
jgi:hypothetical protein